MENRDPLIAKSLAPARPLQNDRHNYYESLPEKTTPPPKRTKLACVSESPMNPDKAAYEASHNARTSAK
jgi:hypothetical protein